MADNSNMTSFKAPLGVVLIGCGRVAEKHLKAISKLKGLELKAVVDVNPDSCKRLLNSVKGFKGVKQFSDYKQAIDEIKPAIVSVTVPSGLHQAFISRSRNTQWSMVLTSFSKSP